MRSAVRVRVVVAAVLALQSAAGLGNDGGPRISYLPDGTPSVTVTGTRSHNPLPLASFTPLPAASFTGSGTWIAHSEGGAGTPGDGKKAKAPAQDNSQRECGNSTGNPVILTTGEKHKDEFDFNSSGDYGLGLRRTYRSFNGTGSMFGANWPSSLEHPKLTFSSTCTPYSGWCAPTNVTHTETDGTKFRYSGGTPGDDGIHYYSVNGAAATGQLMYIRASSRWVLLKARQTRTYFSNGNITSITEPSGAWTREPVARI